MGNPSAPQATRDTKLSEMFKLEKKQTKKRSDINSIEIVKFMSKLPNYLERGENTKEKALNFGVLEWQRLEKWNNLKDTDPRNSRYSPSTSNTSSSFFSTEGSSSARSSPPKRSCETENNPNASLFKGKAKVQDIVSMKRLEKFQDCNEEHGKTVVSASKPASKPRNPSRTRRSSFDCGRNLSSCENEAFFENTVISASKSRDPSPTRHFSIDGGRNLSCCENEAISKKTVISASKSRDLSPTRHFSIVGGQNSSSCENEAISKKAIISASKSKDLSPTHRFTSGGGRNSSSCENEVISEKTVTSASKSRDQSPTHRFTIGGGGNSSSCDNEAISEKTIISASKSKNSSPTRRFSIGFGRNSSSCENGAVLEKTVISASKSRNSSPVRRFSICRNLNPSENEPISEKASLENANSTKDRSISANRARSSPLRRLLDPILKPKGPDSNQFSDGKREGTAKMKLGLRNCRTVNVEKNSHHNKKNGLLSPVQALLQVSMKNGLPLFTFAVENNAEILAATGRKSSSSSKYENGWIYTFFAVREMKKKNMLWLNQGNKDKDHGYVPNVVAQMKVFDPPLPNSSKNDSSAQFVIREFVLFAVDLSPDQPNDELAAVVINIPTNRSRNSNPDQNQNGFFKNNRSGRNCSDDDLFSTTVLLPGGVHGVPSKGEPSSLIERWRTGGSCDCGGWDLGCQVRVFGNVMNGSLNSTNAHSNGGKFELFSQGEVEDNSPVFTMSPYKERVFSVEFASSLTLLQAFSICIAILNSRRPPEPSESSIQGEVPAKYASFPPLSPVGRA